MFSTERTVATSLARVYPSHRPTEEVTKKDENEQSPQTPHTTPPSPHARGHTHSAQSARLHEILSFQITPTATASRLLCGIPPTYAREIDKRTWLFHGYFMARFFLARGSSRPSPRFRVSLLFLQHHRRRRRPLLFRSHP